MRGIKEKDTYSIEHQLPFRTVIVSRHALNRGRVMK
jgi:hypothetical protein